MLMAVYGTLRKGCRLNHALGSNAKYVGQERVFGYEMYHNGSYPYIYQVIGDEAGNNSVLVELWEVDTEHAIEVIRLEQGAGYSLDPVGTSYGVASIFVHHGNKERYTKILDGDFTRWVKKYKPNDYDMEDEEE